MRPIYSKQTNWVSPRVGGLGQRVLYKRVCLSVPVRSLPMIPSGEWVVWSAARPHSADTSVSRRVGLLEIRPLIGPFDTPIMEQAHGEET